MKKLEGKLRKEKGITLIALVITVIIMLILAGVVMLALKSEGGLFEKTQIAANEYNNSSVLEKFKIKMINLNLESLNNTGSTAKLSDLPKLTDTSFPGYYDEEITEVEVTGTEGIVKMDGYTFTVDENLNITHVNGSLLHVGGSSGTAGASNPSEDTEVTIPGQVSDITVKRVEGMVPVTYNTEDSSWYVATQEEINNKSWYDYVDTSVSGQANQSKWANVMLKDNLQVEGITDAKTATLAEMYGKKVTSEGSMYVWIALSTTRNVYGIYDMAGGAWEHTAAYVDGTKGGTVTNSYLTNNGKALCDADAKYKDVYVVSPKADDRVRNYHANADKYGGAIFETSYTSYNGTNYVDSSWSQDTSAFSFTNLPFFQRGGFYDNGNYAGVFAFGHCTGEADAGAWLSFSSFSTLKYVKQIASSIY